MKKIENSFVVTGFVAKDAEIRQFTNTSVARFPLAISRQEKNGDETSRISALMSMEAWRKKENAGSFDQPIGLLLRWISTDGEPTIGVYGVSVWGCPACSRSKEWRNGKGKKAGRCLVCKAAR